MGLGSGCLPEGGRALGRGGLQREEQAEAQPPRRRPAATAATAAAAGPAAAGEQSPRVGWRAKGRVGWDGGRRGRHGRRRHRRKLHRGRAHRVRAAAAARRAWPLARGGLGGRSHGGVKWAFCASDSLPRGAERLVHLGRGHAGVGLGDLGPLGFAEASNLAAHEVPGHGRRGSAEPPPPGSGLGSGSGSG